MIEIERREYSEGIASDGAAILCDGEPLTIEEILHRLRLFDDVRLIIHAAPELNPSNCDHDQVCQLNSDVCEAWNLMA